MAVTGPFYVNGSLLGIYVTANIDLCVPPYDQFSYKILGMISLTDFVLMIQY